MKKYSKSKADRAGGCMGEPMSMAMENKVKLGQQKTVTFGGGNVKPTLLRNEKPHSFMPGGEVGKA